MPDVVVLGRVARRRRAAGPVRVDQVDGEAVTERHRVLAVQAGTVPGPAREIEQRLALADDLVRSQPSARKLHRVTQRGH